MLKRNFDFNKPYRVVLYLRMSSDMQNARSPDQQEAEIKRVLRRKRLSWLIVKIYRDDAVKGKFVRRRRQYQQMLSDIRNNVIEADLILVDTWERLGRARQIGYGSERKWF